LSWTSCSIRFPLRACAVFISSLICCSRLFFCRCPGCAQQLLPHSFSFVGSSALVLAPRSAPRQSVLLVPRHRTSWTSFEFFSPLQGSGRIYLCGVLRHFFFARVVSTHQESPPAVNWVFGFWILIQLLFCASGGELHCEFLCLWPCFMLVLPVSARVAVVLRFYFVQCFESL
jgi:hypothetical protein